MAPKDSQHDLLPASANSPATPTMGKATAATATEPNSHTVGSYVADRRGEDTHPLEAVATASPGASDRNAVCVSANEAMAEELAHVERAREAFSDLDTPKPFGLRSGVALSGGGIRSASFATGFLQALAERGQISRFDYMSAVSGGGYALGWWAALASRLCRLGPQLAPVEAGGKLVVDAAQKAERSISSSAEAQPFELRYVRAHGNYLTLRTGLFSADTAAGFATILRNFVYGLCALGLLAVSGCWLALFFVATTSRLDQHHANMIGLAAALPLMLGWWLTCRGLDLDTLSQTNVSSTAKPENPCSLEPPRSAARQRHVSLRTIAACLTVGTGLVALYFSSTGANSKLQSAEVFRSQAADLDFAATLLLCLGLIDLLLLVFWFGYTWRKQTTPTLSTMPWTLIFTFMLSMWAGLAWLNLLLIPSARELALAGPLPVIPHLAFLMLAMTHAWEWQMFWGSLPGKDKSPRHGFWVKVGSFVLLLFVCLGLLSSAPYIVDSVLDLSPSPIHGTAAFVALLAIFGVVVNAVVAVGEGSQQAGGDHREWWARWSGQLFVVSVCVSSAWACVASVIAHETSVPWLWMVFAAIGLLVLFAVSGFAGGRPGLRIISRVLGGITLLGVLGLALLLASKVQALMGPKLYGYGDVVMAAAMALMSLVVLTVSGPNTFSMHDYYRNRLVRAFLGSSNTTRKPQLPLGTAADDDLDLKELVAGSGEGVTAIRPFPIWCAAVNATTDNHLGLSERKAASFVFTPLRAGLHVDTLERVQTGRRRPDCAMAPVASHNSSKEVTALFEKEPLTLGTAMATSAAAFSTNTGSSTTSERALVFALLGARLGRWFPNPAADRNPSTTLEASSGRNGSSAAKSQDLPSIGWRVGLPVYIEKCGSFGRLLLELANVARRSLFIAEAFSRCNLQSEAVYVTDGGHFENLGVYELVRRKVKLIVCVDATCDPEFKFADLFNLQTKVRTDFGAEIEIKELDDVVSDRKGRRAKVAFKLWRIVYARDSQGVPSDCGDLLYCKSTITGTEPADLEDYRRRVPSFPHVSTVNQWFAESTFEAYRVLGLHVGREIAMVLSDPGSRWTSLDATKGPDQTCSSGA